MDEEKKLKISLKNLSTQIVKEKVEYNGGFFELRGLNTNDIAYLYSYHNEVVAFLLRDFETQKYTKKELASILLREIPSLMYIIIAICMDELEYAGKIGELPVDKTLEILEVIISLTIPDDLNRVKKIIAMMNLT